LNILQILIITSAISIDSFLVGISYSLRKIVVPLTSMVTISGITAFVLGVSMCLGGILKNFFPLMFLQRMGACLLILLGITGLLREYLNKLSFNKTIIKCKIRSLGLVIQILKEPSTADFDVSGVIDFREALYLGSALALDAGFMGLSVSLIGLKIINVVAAGTVGSLLALFLGLKFSGFFTARIQKFEFFPSLILILLGLFKII